MRFPRFLILAVTSIRALSDEAGLTLIEVMVTALMVVLIGTATATALIVTSHTSGDQQLRSEADALAAQDQERLRGLSDEQLGQLTGAGQARTATVGNSSFTVTSKASFVNSSGNNGCNATAAAFYKITSTVGWQEANAQSLYEESLLTRPVYGNLLVQVSDQTGTPLPGVSVVAAGPSRQTGTTDSNGCVLLAGLTPGSYTVSQTQSGAVDPNGNATPSETTTVSSSSASSVTGLYLGQAGLVTASFTSAYGGGEADGVSWIGSGSGGAAASMSSIQTNTATGPVTSIATDSLFPFDGTSGYTSNYAVWGGQCAQQQPPSPYDRFTVNPGSTGVGQPSVQEPALYVGAVQYVNGSSTTTVKPAHVRLTFSGGGCTDSWYPTLSGASTVPSTGWLANPGQPYAAAGTLTACADYNGYYSKVTTGNTSFSALNSVPALRIVYGTNRGTC